MGCDLCGGELSGNICLRCGTRTTDHGIAMPPPVQSETRRQPRESDTGGVILLPGVSEEAASSTSEALADLIAAALPEHLVHKQVHHAMALALSLEVLERDHVDVSPYVECGACGSAVREVETTCPVCGARVFLGARVEDLEEAIESIEAESVSLETLPEWNALTPEFREEVREALRGEPDIMIAEAAKRLRKIREA